MNFKTSKMGERMFSILRVSRPRRALLITLGLGAVVSAGFQNCARSSSLALSSNGSDEVSTSGPRLRTRSVSAANAGASVPPGITITSVPATWSIDSAMHHIQYDTWGHLDAFDGRTAYGWACRNYSDTWPGSSITNSSPAIVRLYDAAGNWLNAKYSILRTESEAAIINQCWGYNLYFRFQITLGDNALNAYAGQALEVRTYNSEPGITAMQLGYITLANPAPGSTPPPAPAPTVAQSVDCTIDATPAAPSGGINGSTAL